MLSASQLRMARKHIVEGKGFYAMALQPGKCTAPWDFEHTAGDKYRTAEWHLQLDSGQWMTGFLVFENDEDLQKRLWIIQKKCLLRPVRLYIDDTWEEEYEPTIPAFLGCNATRGLISPKRGFYDHHWSDGGAPTWQQMVRPLSLAIPVDKSRTDFLTLAYRHRATITAVDVWEDGEWRPVWSSLPHRAGFDLAPPNEYYAQGYAEKNDGFWDDPYDCGDREMFGLIGDQILSQ